MAGLDLVGLGAPNATRRWFLRLGGGLLGLALLPDLAVAAKVAKAAAGQKKGSGSSEPAQASKSAATGPSSGAKASASGPKSRATGGTAKSAKSGKPARTASSAPSARASKRGRSAKRSSSSKHAQRKGKGSSRLAADRRRSEEAQELEQAEARLLESPPSLISPEGFTPGSRSLAFYCVHTGESLSVDYYIDGKYEPDGLRAIDHLLRDYHTDEVCPMDPELLNQLHGIRTALGSRETYRVYSGYRSPETNAAYRRSGYGVAEHSFHIKGRAIDVALPGRDLRQMRNIALAMGEGGVGYYPWAGFIHLDSGPVRRW